MAWFGTNIFILQAIRVRASKVWGVKKRHHCINKCNKKNKFTSSIQIWSISLLERNDVIRNAGLVLVSSNFPAFSEVWCAFAHISIFNDAIWKAILCNEVDMLALPHSAVAAQCAQNWFPCHGISVALNFNGLWTWNTLCHKILFDINSISIP